MQRRLDLTIFEKKLERAKRDKYFMCKRAHDYLLLNWDFHQCIIDGACCKYQIIPFRASQFTSNPVHRLRFVMKNIQTLTSKLV